eukprot:1195333-Prorocentrum_minimum.AAC.5
MYSTRVKSAVARGGRGPASRVRTSRGGARELLAGVGGGAKRRAMLKGQALSSGAVRSTLRRSCPQSPFVPCRVICRGVDAKGSMQRGRYNHK